MKKHILFILSFLFYSMTMISQNQTLDIKGTVVDEHGEPMIGVSVTVKHMPGLGVITNIDGNFSIKVEPYSHLVFSYISYAKQEILIKPEDSRELRVTLRESKESVLEQVTVTGTGPQKKVTLTGAITTVEMGDLNTPTSSIANALAGNVAGVMAMQTSGKPGAVSEFWIRGISTFGGGSSALILVDGFERTLDELNIEDIESFTVLKDASTTAIYGSRGANGVILITSKRGYEGKVKADVRFDYTVRGRTITPKLIDGYQYASMVNEAKTTRNQEARYSDDDLRLFKTGLDPDLYPNVNWMDLLLKDSSPGYKASVNVTGGANVAKYFLSVSYLDESGNFNVDKSLKNYDTNSNYQRWNYRMNVDLELTKSTKIEVGVAGALAKNNHSPNDKYLFETLLGFNPIMTPVRFSDGSAPIYRAPGKPDSDAITIQHVNPWTLATETGFSETWKNTVQTNVTVIQKLDAITEGLSATARIGFDNDNSNTLNRYKMPALWRSQNARGANGELELIRVRPEENMTQSSVSEGFRKEFIQADLIYNRQFGDHNVGGILKYTQESTKNTANVGTDIIKGVNRNYQTLAGNASYGYKNRYFANFNFGYNGSENFAKGHQWGFFPAYSVAWNIAEEDFLKSQRGWLEMLKIRYSYGKVGDDRIGVVDRKSGDRFPYLTDFNLPNIASDYYGRPPSTDKTNLEYNWGDINTPNIYTGLYERRVASEFVTWEIAKKHDLGLDLYLFGDKLSFTVDYFTEKREGIYMDRRFLPQMVGIKEAYPRSNIGKVSTKGVDGTFKATEKLGNVRLTLRGNFTYGRNKITEYDELYSRYPYLKNAGYRVEQSRGLIALGLFKDYDDIRNSPRQTFGEVMPGDIKYKDVNGDGIINSDDVVALGASRRPELVYGIGLSAEWNGFDLNIHFQGSEKTNYFINGASVYPFSYGEWGNIHYDIANANRWILGVNEDPNAEIPRLTYDVSGGNNHRPSTQWLKDGGYLRLKTFEVGYTLPTAFVNKLYLQKARLRFVGQNLLTFSKFKMWDPEMGSVNGRDYPLPKTYTIGLVINI